ncbi:nucleoside triphosphate pyrophosphohydrolase (plasmid) [Halorussus limi]|uniref:Nucleoside triphosphate pyrophosphohydrolase n=1 Tax=Halorussus limi TaxID=2938695 RepID=A0A8U0I118_9EURY|nr:nucleoside triphosphate pyrophosphohydrolase [Halorussus limi]UPV76596.1 nucleoside triphosphate pyrophosphohydrolase [Halorussus limi]
MTEYDKLVRDRIPEVVRENGETPVTHVADGDEYRRRLREKLCEEAGEFRESGDPEELADVLEVLDAIRDAEEFDAERVERLRAEKAEERGRFEDGVVLERVE